MEDIDFIRCPEAGEKKRAALIVLESAKLLDCRCRFAELHKEISCSSTDS